MMIIDVMDVSMIGADIRNLHQTGQFWDIRCAPLADGITHEFVVAGFDLAYAIIKIKIGIDPFLSPPTPPDCAPSGHANNKALTPLGEFTVEEMMRMGILIDLDHMSTLALQEALTIAETHQYPVNVGHNAPRAPSWSDHNETEKTDDDYERIAALGGMVGLGSADKASHFVRAYQYVRALVDGS